MMRISRFLSTLAMILFISILSGCFTGDDGGSSGGGGGSVPGTNPVGPTAPSSTVPVVITESSAVTLPASASGDVDVVQNTILEVPNRINGSMVPISEIYDITLDGGSADFGTDFAVIEYEYDDDDLVSSGVLEEFIAFYYDGSEWKMTDKIEVDPENNKIKVYTTHFTPFVLTAYDQNATATGVAAPPAKIEEIFPDGIGGNGNAVFSIIDENFRYYQDRDYTIRPATDEYPENKAAFEHFGFKGALGVSTINGGAGLGEMQFHKYFEANNYIRFTAHMDLDVYVMYDTRGGTGKEDGSQDATWLYAYGFTKTDYYVQTTDGVGYYSVYVKTYDEGDDVYLHGNLQGVVDDPINTNYWMIVKPAGNFDEYAASATCGDDSDVTPPAAVSGLTAQSIDGAIRLEWTNPVDDDFAGVVVRRSTISYPEDPSDGEAPTGTFNGSEQFLDASVLEGGEYYYTIFSVDENANWTVANVSETYHNPNGDAIPPGDVYITGVVESYNSVMLNWNNPADMDIDFIKVETPGHATQIISAGAGTCNFLGLDMNTEYTFTITVYDYSGNNSTGKKVTATTGVYMGPIDNVIITAINKGENFITFTWTDPVNPLFDFVEISCTDGITIINEIVDDGVQTGTLTGLLPDTEYVVTIGCDYTDGSSPEEITYNIRTNETGSGTNDIIFVSTAEELNNVRNDLDGDYIQIADIDLSAYQSGEGWVPIGNNGSNSFTGSFNGNDHEITGLVINRTSYPTGLFGSIMESEISNVKIVDGMVTGSNWTGGLVGNAGDSAKIINCSFTGSIIIPTDIPGNVGGLVGGSNGIISNCNSTGSITVEDYRSSYIGGLVGGNYNDGDVSDSYSNVSVAAGYNAGGLVGQNSGNITDCYSTGTITGQYKFGGLVGQNSGNISDCYSISSMTSNDYMGTGINMNVGGLVGDNTGNISNSYSAGSYDENNLLCNRVGGLVGYADYGSISNCYSTLSISISSSSALYIGGLVGEMKNVSISKCFSSSNVNVSGGSLVGGLVGWILDDRSEILQSYFMGSVTGDSYVGGLVGDASYGSISNCYSTGFVTGRIYVGGCFGSYGSGSYSNLYWNSTVNSGLYDVGYSNIDDPNITGLTTAQMKDAANVGTNYVGWDFITVWDIDSTGVINDGYPYLRGMP